MNHPPSPSEPQAWARHFAGSMTQYLVHYLQNHVTAGTLEAVLGHSPASSESPTCCATRPGGAATPNSAASWRRRATLLGGPPRLLHRGGRQRLGHLVDARNHGEFSRRLARLAPFTPTSACRRTSLSPLVVADGEEVGPTEWMISSRFTTGFEPFREFCSFTAGLFSISPKMFGFPAAEVIEERPVSVTARPSACSGSVGKPPRNG